MLKHGVVYHIGSNTKARPVLLQKLKLCWDLIAYLATYQGPGVNILSLGAIFGMPVLCILIPGILLLPLDPETLRDKSLLVVTSIINTIIVRAPCRNAVCMIQLVSSSEREKTLSALS